MKCDDPFVNMDVASAYSFLWGTFHPDELVNKVASMGQGAVALTDIFSTYGAVRFWKACKKGGVQAILGARVRVAGYGWLILLARDFNGYGNICRIISAGLQHAGKAGKASCITGAVVPFSVIRSFSRGICCIAGGYGSAVRFMAAGEHREGAGIKLMALRSVFKDEGALFIGVQNHLPEDMEANQVLIHHAARLSLPIVPVNHVAFLSPDEYSLHRMMVEIQRRHHHRNIEPLPNTSFSLLSGREMEHRLHKSGLSGDIIRQLMANIPLAAQACSRFSFPAGRLQPPVFRQKGQADRELGRKAVLALARRFEHVPARYVTAIDRELSEIRQRGLSDFFLLVSEICEFARSKGIRHSVRGSAASSLVVHLLHNGPDPIRHGLLFQRFMNSGRMDLPDIDLDFDSERRDEVTSWLMGRFGNNISEARAALVATIHTFRPRSAVRLAARAMGYSLPRISVLVKALPWSLRGIGLKDAVERLPELASSPLVKEHALLNTAARLEGLPFQASVHLGGVILAPDRVTDWSPVWLGKKGMPVAQLDKDDIDALGLLKVDLLGLRMHTAIEKSLSVLREIGVDTTDLIDRLPHDDPAVYRLLEHGDTLGIFQLESSGQRNLICRLRPRCFQDIVAEISLFRPGPVQGDMVNRYLKNRELSARGRNRSVSQIHDSLKEILAETFGVIVFQEQVLRIVHTFAGFSYGEADGFRRAMTKDRSPQEMARLKASFIQGALKQGHSRQEADKVFRKIAAFAAYGFCKAHAVAFASITWQSAWLKAHYPAAFYLGLLNAGHVGSYPPFVILNEARRKGIAILPPHVNRSGLEYRLENGAIRCPLLVIRHVGRSRAEAIVEERRRGGPFRSQEEFFARVALPDLVRKMVIISGAVDFSEGNGCVDFKVQGITPGLSPGQMAV